MKIRPIDAEIFHLLTDGTRIFQSCLSLLRETTEQVNITNTLQKNLLPYQNHFQSVFHKFSCERKILQQHISTLSTLINCYCNSPGSEAVADDAYIIKKNFETELQPFEKNFTQITALKRRLEDLTQNDNLDKDTLIKTLKDLMQDFNYRACHLEYLE